MNKLDINEVEKLLEILLIIKKLLVEEEMQLEDTYALSWPCTSRKDLIAMHTAALRMFTKAWL